MTSPTRSVIVRLALEPSSYIAGASRAAGATTALEREVARVGPAAETSMARAARGAGAAEGAFRKLDKVTGVLGISLGGLAAVGGAVAGALAIKSAADLQQNLVKLSTTAGESTKNLHMVGQGLLDMAGQVGIGVNELAKGMYTVESGGFHGADGLKVMRAAAQGAVQEQADLSKVTDAVTTILHDYHLGADQAANVTSKLVTAVSHGKTTFDELTGSLHSVTPLAAKMGISIADVTGTLSAMTASGESTDQATQNMANTLQHLANPTSTMINELAQLGISTDDLQKSLSQRGLAGTLQMVEEAIVQHVDPATQRVLLPALNKSKSAAEDLQIMLAQMPPTVAKLAQGLADGSVGLTDYRKEVRGLGGQAEVMGTQFMNLFQSSQGFSNVLKGGGPAAQVFTAAMAKAFGTTAALNVSLQTTGENAHATNDAIKDIAGSSAQADGNIRGWAEVQGNFNQQLHEAEQTIASLATEAGQHLLPMLTSAFGYVNRDVLPAVEHLGGMVGDAGHAFGQLPGPIKETVLALGGLALANKIGLFGALNAVTGKVAWSFAAAAGGAGRFGDEMAVQQRLAQMEATAISEVDAALGGLSGSADLAAGSLSRVQLMMRGWDTKLAATAAEEDVATASTGRLAGAMGVLSTRGMAGVAKAGSGLMGLIGGAWGIALLGGFVAWQQYSEGVDEVKAAMSSAKTTGQELFNTYVKLGTVYGSQADAARKAVTDQQAWAQAALDNGVSQQTLTAALRGNKQAQKEVADAAQVSSFKQSASQGIIGLGLDYLSGKYKENGDAAREFFNNLGTNTTAADLFMTSIDDTKGALEDYQTAAQRIFGDGNIANRGMDTLTKGMDELARSTGSSESSLQGITDILAGLTGQGVAAAQATADVTTATIDTTKAFQEMSKGALDAKGNIDLSSEAGVGLFNSLKDVASGFKTAVNDSYAAAGGINNAGAASAAAGKTAQTLYEKFILTATGAGMSQEAAETLATQLGLVPGDVVTKFTQPGMTESQGAADLLRDKVLSIPDSHTVHTSALTSDAMTALGNLGFTVKTLPDGTVDVIANTAPARQAIAQLSNDYRHYAINVGVGGSFGVAAAATGAILPGFTPGRDVHRFVSPSAGMALDLSGGEGIARPEVVQAMGPDRFMGLNRAAQSGGVGGVRKALGFAAGGFFPGMYMVADVGIDPASMAAAERSIRAALTFAPGAPAAVSGNVALGRQIAASMFGWTGAQWNALYALGNRESGWRNTAQNPTSTAYGIGQLLDGTWASTGIGKTSDPRLQEIAMDRYIAGRYGTPLNAWAHEQRFGWYDQGGPWPSGTIGINTSGRTETVRTAEQEQSLQGRLRSREMAGGGGGSGITAEMLTEALSRIAGSATAISVDARGFNAEQIANAAVRKLRKKEFLARV